MSTILDVAKLAGVSKTTVSRVITQNGSVSHKTYEKIVRAMRELDYVPSYMAQGIRTGKTHTIVLFVPDYKNIYYNSLYAGIEKVVLKRGYTVMLCNTNGEPKREIEYAENVLRKGVDGIIYNTYVRDSKSIEYFLNLARAFPVVFMNDILPEGAQLACVLPEERDSTASAVRYLYNRGCKRIAYLHMPPNISVVEKRYQGYLQGLEECGLCMDKETVCECDDANLTFIEKGQKAAERLMALPHPPDAILSANDTMAIGAIIYLTRHGYKIPDNIRIIGFDNIETCNIVCPNLTTLAQPTVEMGSAAANMLINMIEKGIENEKKQMIFKPALFIRESA